MQTLHVDYPAEKISRSKAHIEAHRPGRPVQGDRVPVNFCLVPRFFAPIFDIDYEEIYRDAKTQFHWLLQFAKYQLENIPCDMLTEPVITIAPFFDNVTTSSAFGCEVMWLRNETAHAMPCIHDVADIERFELPSIENSVVGKCIRWWLEMKELARDVRVDFAGTPGEVNVGGLNLNILGPHSVAVDMCGDDLYWWMLEYPEMYRMLMSKVVKGMMILEDASRAIDTRPRGGFGVAEDAAAVLSEEHFIKHVAPYDLMLFGRYADPVQDARGMHMCGNTAHLLGALADVLKITGFNLFGYQTPLDKVADIMGGRVSLWGNINPMMMLDGTRGQVREACLDVLARLAPYGGLMLGDGANICPGTPLENIAAVAAAAEEYAGLVK